MNILVNGRFFSRRVTGVERYASEIMTRLEDSVRLIRPANDRQAMLGHAWEQFILPVYVNPGEVLWSPANTGPLVVTDQVLTLHDLSPLEHPEWFRPVFGLWYRIFLPALLRRVKRVVASSEFVRQKLLARFDLEFVRTAVISGGVDVDRFRPDQQTLLNIPERYILFVGSLQKRKNLMVLLQAWGMICKRFPGVYLLIAGGRDKNQRAEPLSLVNESVCILGYVSEDELPGLYSGAIAFVLPSLDEGFGLPVLEAMACGVPVIASRAGSLPEVIGQAGLLFNPICPSDLANKIERLLSDEYLRSELVSRGLTRVQQFSWKRSAGELWEILQSCQ